jgi:hypothetical protein
MKKYLFGMLALVLAVGFSAFTKPAKKFTAVYFEFQGDKTDPDKVKDATLWVEIGSSGSCTTADEQPCRIEASSTDLQSGTFPRTLDYASFQNTVLDAVDGDIQNDDIYVPVRVSGPSLTINNTELP